MLDTQHKIPRRQFLQSCVSLASTSFLSCSLHNTALAKEDDSYSRVDYLPQLPTSLGKILSSHIDRILEKGYAQKVSPDDFFHGHVLWKPGKRLDPELLKGSLDAVAGILYHTAEHNGRWESEKALPYKQRTPRSIFGDLEGNIMPVKDFLDIDKLIRTRPYQRKGTVYETEFSHQKEGFAEITWPDELEISSASQFNFGFLSDGRFLCAAGRIDAQFSTQWQGRSS